ncbi:MAG: CHASE2 domain-containing protein [Phormidesmis sp.]
MSEPAKSESVKSESVPSESADPSPPAKKMFRRRSKSSAKTADATVTLTNRDRFATWQQRVIAKHWRFAVSATCTAIAAGAVGLELGIVNLWERQVQSLFFELRGPVAAPENVVILAIDEESLSQGQHYRDDPERYEVLEPIASWPWKREAYAKVIDRLMSAGAKTVALDILFTEDSAHGAADDVAFTQVLTEYNERVVLASKYGNLGLEQGDLFQPFLPLPQFQDAGVRLGSINFHIEHNQQIHRLGQTFLAEALPQPTRAFAVIEDRDIFDVAPRSFAQATLEAANVPYADEPQENIFFHGPRGTFEQVPFWYVLDDDQWQNRLQSGQFFEDKIVIIGSTAAASQDFHQAPFSQSMLYPYPMAGVEILANAIATLEQDISPTRAIKRPALNALVVLGLGLLIAALINKTQRHSRRALIAGGGLSAWLMISYIAFVAGNIILITGTPIFAISSFGLLDFGISFTGDRFRRKRLRTTLARYATSPLVQEIISQQDDFQDLLDVYRADIIGKLLQTRYRILEVIGSGGFGETYLAQDTLRPGNPVCVVKQLKIISDNPKSHYLARRLFKEEAVALGTLGEHGQIPRLLAYFEEQQTFYLVQEMIVGTLLRDILARNRPLSPKAVVKLLSDLLPVISFVHSQGVIHRDIKPSNIIHRSKDDRYVLIDFGAVKTISNRLPESATKMPSTVGIGTQGYMPSEQSAGMPSERSDIYALGITAIEALTGRPPHAFKRSEDGEIIWSHTIEDISADLSSVINKMVRYDFNKRYASSEEVLSALKQIDDNQLTDQPAIASESFQMMDGTTLNQGTRPGVIDTNSDLSSTQILPEDWLNDMDTIAEKSETDDEID